MSLDYQKLINWRFPAVTRHYTAEDAVRFARGFGAGLSGPLHESDAPYLSGRKALPVIAVPLTDGEFWQQNPETGIDWRQIIHAEEALTMHRPLPAQGGVVITQRVEEIFDRGTEKGAVMLQKQFLHDENNVPLASIDVTTVLRGNGGFGGKSYEPAKVRLPEDRAPDATVEIVTPSERDAIFRLSAEIKAAASAGNGKSMMRGVGCFGLAGRGVLQLACDNQPERLKRLGVRYAGPMYTDEVMRIELWHVQPGMAVFRMWSVGRKALVLNNCYVEFSA
ncbi:MaoC family dehydratase N-terminal domain-containing protein [Noviherbaspirillum saxi]|uniref:MaoC family dehydratase N-terminal domain-containing protein n=1 Tax=Noviherbaspirillum saxi TaxID=2320863 RepID=UPI001314BEFE|nr:MaoC family dehydratase N-terminal domain-containing protein [Noviherbaspirillum saxi]